MGNVQKKNGGDMRQLHLAMSITAILSLVPISASAASWQTSVEHDGVTLCIRNKYSTEKFEAEAKFIVTSPNGINYSSSTSVREEEWACASFPKQFNIHSNLRAEFLNGKYTWRVIVDGQDVGMGGFTFTEHRRGAASQRTSKTHAK